ncbi:hypothetical protein OOK29_42985 [Streptomyces phaeochromogenes]|nr:hypothetical protein [Streptomyces phaeochromogenes]MCX5604911.1 hypothetical protein [Streptomyces phaeochromogenes]
MADTATSQSSSTVDVQVNYCFDVLHQGVAWQLLPLELFGSVQT